MSILTFEKPFQQAIPFFRIPTKPGQNSSVVQRLLMLAVVFLFIEFLVFWALTFSDLQTKGNFLRHNLYL
jgi:hypothetical protein